MRLMTWTDEQAADVYARCDSVQSLLDGIRETADANDLATSRRLMQRLEQTMYEMLADSQPREAKTANVRPLLAGYLENTESEEYGPLHHYLRYCNTEYGWSVLIAGVIRELTMHAGPPGTPSYHGVSSLREAMLSIRTYAPVESDSPGGSRSGTTRPQAERTLGATKDALGVTP